MKKIELPLQIADLSGVFCFLIAVAFLWGMPLLAVHWIIAGVLFLILGRLGRIHHWQKHVAQQQASQLPPRE